MPDSSGWTAFLAGHDLRLIEYERKEPRETTDLILETKAP